MVMVACMFFFYLIIYIYIYIYICMYVYMYIQGVSGGILNILGGGSMDYSK